MPHLARFYHWAPREVGELTGAEIRWWTEQGNILVERERPQNVR